MIITPLQHQTIINELNYYFKYDKILNSMERSNLLYSMTKYINYDNLENIIIDNNYNIERNWMEFIKVYFISHVNDIGDIVSLEHNAYTNQEIRKNYHILKKIEKAFIDRLKMDNKPLYFLDVDNTLTDNAYLSSEKVNFISNWNNKKNIILNTGKVSDSIMNVIDECKLNDNYYSCLNGSVIVKNGKFEVINRIGKISKEIINHLNETEINYITYYEDRIHVIKELNEENIFNLKKYNEWYIDYNVPTDYENIVKVLTFINDGDNQNEDIVRRFVEKYPNLVCVRTAKHCFEILHKDQHKGNSVRKISEYLNRYYRCSIGVGDSMNDLRMLDYVGFPYVVSNVSLELKQYGFSIIEGSRDVDIVNILKKYE